MSWRWKFADDDSIFLTFWEAEEAGGGGESIGNHCEVQHRPTDHFQTLIIGYKYIQVCVSVGRTSQSAARVL